MRNKEHGYLMIDHRASPGLPEEIARKNGLDPRYCKEGQVFEASTLTCAHCRTVVVKNPFRTRERASCPKCNFHYICDACALAMARPDYEHMPFAKFAEMAMAAPLGSSIDLLQSGREKETD